MISPTVYNYYYSKALEAKCNNYDCSLDSFASNVRLSSYNKC